MAHYAVVVHDPERNWDYLTVGPFEERDEAQAEAHRWRSPNVRAMVRFLWDGDDLRRELEAMTESTGGASGGLQPSGEADHL